MNKPTEEINDMPYIAALSFNKLEEEPKIIIKSHKPIICKFCGSVLVDFSQLIKKENKYEWVCEFCLNKNEIDSKEIEEIKKTKEEIPTSISMEELSLLFKEIMDKEEGSKDKISDKGKEKEDLGKNESLIGIIDISGSMASGKLEAVKHSLVQILKNLKFNAPQTIFSLITFTDYVEIYPNPNKSISIFEDKYIYNESEFEKHLVKLIEDIKIGPMAEFLDDWIKKVEELQVEGYTALGPGLYAGVILAENKIIRNKNMIARIILLTDGLANLGFGGIEGVDPKKAKMFYEELGKRCLDDRIIVDLVGVQDPNSRLGLDVIGVITDITGGAMSLISKEEIESAFNALREKEYIARNAIIRIYSGDLLSVEDISGFYVSNLPKKDGEPIKLGAIDPSREIYIKFKQNKEINVSEIPIQIQIEYLDKNNVKSYKIIRSNVKVESDPNIYKTNYYADIYTNMELQKISSSNVDINKKNEMSQKLLNNVLKFGVAKNVDISKELIEFELNEYANMKKCAENVADQQSLYAAQVQNLNRMSFDDKMEKIKKKKNV